MAVVLLLLLPSVAVLPALAGVLPGTQWASGVAYAQSERSQDLPEDVLRLAREAKEDEIVWSDYLIWSVPIWLFIGGWGLKRSLKARQRLRAGVADVTAVGDVKEGMAMVTGIAVSSEPVVSPVTHTECIYYEHQVDEHWYRVRKYTTKEVVPITDANDPLGISRRQGHVSDVEEVEKENHSDGWKKVAKGSASTPFYVRDATGELLIDPEHASFEAQKRFDDVIDRNHDFYWVFGANELADSTGQRRMKEEIVPLNGDVTVTGPVVRREDGSLQMTKGRSLFGGDEFEVRAGPPDRSGESEQKWAVRGLWLVGASILGVIMAVGVQAIN